MQKICVNILYADFGYKISPKNEIIV